MKFIKCLSDKGSAKLLTAIDAHLRHPEQHHPAAWEVDIHPCAPGQTDTASIEFGREYTVSGQPVVINFRDDELIIEDDGEDE